MSAAEGKSFGRRPEAQGSVYTREGVIYVLWNGQEHSAEAFEADRMPGNMSMNALQGIMDRIETERNRMDAEASK